jgi:anti-sigma B factor antagonist
VDRADAEFTLIQPAGSPSCTVKARGEIDIYTGQQLRDALREALAARPAQIVIDMAAVTFIDSSGLGVLIAAFKRAQDSGIQLALQAPTGRVLRVLELTGLHRALPILPGPGHTADGATAKQPGD